LTVIGQTIPAAGHGRSEVSFFSIPKRGLGRAFKGNL
jgi:hypothetical protein